VVPPHEYETIAGKVILVAVTRKPTGEFELTQSAAAGTARRVMDGYVYVPRKIFFPDEA